MSIFLNLNSDNLFNDDFEKTLMLLKEWFTIHENMDFANRTRRVKGRWHSLKLAIQKRVFSKEEERAETNRIRQSLSALIQWI